MWREFRSNVEFSSGMFQQVLHLCGGWQSGGISWRKAENFHYFFIQYNFWFSTLLGTLHTTDGTPIHYRWYPSTLLNGIPPHHFKCPCSFLNIVHIHARYPSTLQMVSLHIIMHYPHYSNCPYTLLNTLPKTAQWRSWRWLPLGGTTKGLHGYGAL